MTSSIRSDDIRKLELVEDVILSQGWGKSEDLDEVSAMSGPFATPDMSNTLNSC